MKRQDKRGRNLRVGEYYDEANERYMFRKMVNGRRYTISNEDLAELRREENRLLISIEEENLADTELEKLTLDEYYQIWISNSAKSGRKATTYTNYKAYYKAHILGKELGKMQISKIRKIHLQRLFNGMIEKGSKKSTLNNMKGCLNLIFSEAEDDGAIIKNPCRNIRFSNTCSGKREAVSPEQLRLFMDYLKQSDEFSVYYPFFVVLFNIGVRVGELCGVTWDCVDLKKSRLTINKSVNRYRREDFGFTVALGTPKSRQSTREISLNDVVIEAFIRQGQIIRDFGIKPASIYMVDDYGRVIEEVHDLVFVQMNGSPWNEPAVIELIHRIVKRQNADVSGTDKPLLHYFTPHQARHTYTTLAYEAGIDEKEVAQRLGHASEITTRDVYTHLRGEKREEQERAAAEKIRIS